MNADWFLETIVKFCRHKEFEQIIYDSYDLLQKGEESSIETRVKAAQEISLVKDLGLDYFQASKERLQRMKDRPNLVSTGYNSIDEKLFGGFEMGGLNVFIGLPNAGKSLILQNLAVNWALMGKNTVYFTIEMGQDQIAVRKIQNVIFRISNILFVNQLVDDNSSNGVFNKSTNVVFPVPWFLLCIQRK